jgi:hypothetical protein
MSSATWLFSPFNTLIQSDTRGDKITKERRIWTRYVYIAEYHVYKAPTLFRDTTLRLPDVQVSLFTDYITKAVDVTDEFHSFYRYFRNNSAPYEFGCDIDWTESWKSRPEIMGAGVDIALCKRTCNI